VIRAACSNVIDGVCRYGAALALGVACAGTGLKEAVALLETLSNDPVSYVRQGALIASALVLVQQNDQTCARVAHFRQLYTKVDTRSAVSISSAAGQQPVELIVSVTDVCLDVVKLFSKIATPLSISLEFLQNFPNQYGKNYGTDFLSL